MTREKHTRETGQNFIQQYDSSQYNSTPNFSDGSGSNLDINITCTLRLNQTLPVSVTIVLRIVSKTQVCKRVIGNTKHYAYNCTCNNNNNFSFTSSLTT